MTARRRWNAGDRWARAAGCECPDRAAGQDGYGFLASEPWVAPRTRERAAGYPSRAAGATEDFETLRRLVCGQPGWRQLSTVGRDVLALADVPKLSAWVVQVYGLARSSSFGLLPIVQTKQIVALFDAMDGLFALCAPRAGGLRGDSLRALSTAIDIVGHPAAAVPLYGVATAVGASGLMVKIVGVAATAWVGGAIAAVVALCQILLATGIPAQLRAIARDLDAEDAGLPPPPIPSPIFGTAPVFGMLPGQEGTWVGPEKYPTAPTTGGGGGFAISLGVLGLGALFLKGAL